MKKKICIILVLIVLTLFSSACGNSTTSSTSTKTEATSASESSTVKIENKSKNKYEAYSGETIIDNEICTFKITGAEDDSLWGFTLNVYCENKTDKTLMFSWEDVSVNGFMMDPLWATEVAPGKKANSTISFLSDDIDTADEVVFTLRIYDSEDWMASPEVEEEYSIYPTGLSKDTVESKTKDFSNATIILDDEQIKFYITDLDPKNMWGYTLMVYCENNTDKALMFSWQDVSVNGFMVDPYWATEVAAGKKDDTSISFFSSDFETNGIESVEEIEFTLRIYDSNDWMADPLVENVYTFNP